MRSSMRPLLLLSVMLLPLTAQAQEKSSTVVPSITVQGEAVVKLAPDQVTIPVTVREENADMRIAKEHHDSKLRALLKLAADTGIAKDKMQTASTAITPQYDYRSGDKPRLRGYEVQTAINFTLIDLSKLAGFMDGVINAGIDMVGSVSYSLQHDDKAKDEALTSALIRAHDKAQMLAETAKMTLGGTLMIEEGEATHSFAPPRPMIMRNQAFASGTSMPAPDLPAGLVEIHQSVTATYALK